MATAYANPQVLVETAWVADHLKDPNLRVIEVSVDTAAFEQGHIPGAVALNWFRDLEEHPVRDIASKAKIEQLLGQAGVGTNTKVILYGDNNNWFATYAYWLLKHYGHSDAQIMNGGRKKWIDEGRALTKEATKIAPVRYSAKDPDPSVRAARDLVVETAFRRNRALVDVRSPREFSGELLAPENLPQEGAQRGGHVPGAANIPWGENCRPDGTFKSADELKSLYAGKGVTPDKEVVAYCRIGERSSLTWFALKELLGYPRVRNYDGSWTEYGSLVGVPVEKP
ncbi:MAG TPA: sulfurtransferase [Candidatus Sulfotelmatobacter sp.]|nr:sulfurtransferase [Candidatus Sulfotelmatobacter sp.]